MSPEPEIYVLDTGPLSHFARSQWLGVLKVVLKDFRVLIPDVVDAELRNGLDHHQYLQAILDAEWIFLEPWRPSSRIARAAVGWPGAHRVVAVTC